MKEIRYRWMGDPKVLITYVPKSQLPGAVLAELLAFRAGANPGDIYEMREAEDGVFDVIATGTAI